MSRAFRSFFLAVVCLVAGTWLLCSPRETAPPGVVTPAPVTPVPASPTPAPGNPSSPE